MVLGVRDNFLFSVRNYGLRTDCTCETLYEKIVSVQSLIQLKQALVLIYWCRSYRWCLCSMIYHSQWLMECLTFPQSFAISVVGEFDVGPSVTGIRFGHADVVQSIQVLVVGSHVQSSALLIVIELVAYSHSPRRGH